MTPTDSSREILGALETIARFVQGRRAGYHAESIKAVDPQESDVEVARTISQRFKAHPTAPDNGGETPNRSTRNPGTPLRTRQSNLRGRPEGLREEAKVEALEKVSTEADPESHDAMRGLPICPPFFQG